MIPAEHDAQAADDDSGDPRAPSKSQRKRESSALQDLGAELVALSTDRLARIEMPERLRDAIMEARRITSHEGKRRQMQFVGKLMREVDSAPLQAAVDAAKGVSAVANARQHALERLRERLMADDAVGAEIARDLPGIDIQHLRQLRRNALREAEQGKPPRAYREIFRVLREALEHSVHADGKVSPGGTAEGDDA